MSGFSPLQLAGLGAFVFFAGAVDALAGGGGLISLPAFLAFGLDPALLLGTNKLMAGFGTSAAVAGYWRKLRLPIAPMLPVVAATVVGSLIGAGLTLLLDPAWLKPALLVAMPLLLAALYTHPHWAERDDTARFSERELAVRASSAGAAIGAYDGFFGPGTGTFFALALARFCRYGLLGATARAKLLNLASNMGALAAFLWSGRVHWRLGLLMGAANVAGNVAGARLGVKGGAKAIRPALVAVCAGLFVKLAFDLWR